MLSIFDALSVIQCLVTPLNQSSRAKRVQIYFLLCGRGGEFRVRKRREAREGGEKGRMRIGGRYGPGKEEGSKGREEV